MQQGFVTKVQQPRIAICWRHLVLDLYDSTDHPLFVPPIIKASGIEIPTMAGKSFAFVASALYCAFIVMLCVALSSLTYYKIECP
jgi:hypothetical protein